MRIRAVLGGILGSITVLVVGWQAGAAAAHDSATGVQATTSGTGTTTSPSTGSGTSGSTTPVPTSTSSPGATTSGAGSSTSGTYAGSVSQTQFGPVQVQIVVKSGKITDVVALQLTNMGGRSQEISNYAAPILRREVLAAQSAKISSVGGATYTSDGYVSSLQSALDKAGL